MHRGIKKQINYPEEIERIEARIVHHTNSIKELKERKQDLERQQKLENFNVVEDFMEAYHLSADELVNICAGQLTKTK